MEQTKIERLKEHAQEIAKILYGETNPEQVNTLEGIEETVRELVQTHINSEIGNFLSEKVAEQRQDETEK